MEEQEDWEQYLAFLDEEDRANPFSVLEDIYRDDSPFNTRTALLDIFCAAMSSPWLETDSPEEKGNRMSLMSNTLRLYECAYHIVRMRKAGQLIYRVVEPDAGTSPESSI